jgi:hypothetical protein
VDTAGIIDVYSDVSLSSVSYVTNLLRFSTTASAGTVAHIRAYVGTYSVPKCVKVNGVDYTAYKVTTEAELVNYPICWYYDTTNNIVHVRLSMQVQ